MASSPVPLWESSRVSDGTSSVAQHCNMARVGAVVLSREACAHCRRGTAATTLSIGDLVSRYRAMAEIAWLPTTHRLGRSDGWEPECKPIRAGIAVQRQPAPSAGWR